MLSLIIASRSPSHFACLMELMPRSDRARLIDFVKLRGVVEGSRRSVIFPESDSFTLEASHQRVTARYYSGSNGRAGASMVAANSR